MRKTAFRGLPDIRELPDLTHSNIASHGVPYQFSADMSSMVGVHSADPDRSPEHPPDGGYPSLTTHRLLLQACRDDGFWLRTCPRLLSWEKGGGEHEENLRPRSRSLRHLLSRKVSLLLPRQNFSVVFKGRHRQISFALFVMRRRLLGFDPRIAGSCSCISGLPTGFRRYGAGGRRPGSDRTFRPGVRRKRKRSGESFPRRTPTTRVRRRISRMMRSSGLLVLSLIRSPLFSNQWRTMARLSGKA